MNDIFAKAIVEIQPTRCDKDFSQQGLQEVCYYIAKIGTDNVGGLNSPATYQKYTADLQKAIIALNGKLTEVTL